WTWESARDHAVSTPAASAIREAIGHAREGENWVEGATELGKLVLNSAWRTAWRWWDGGLGVARRDVLYAAGLEEEKEGGEEEKEEEKEEEPKWEWAMRKRSHLALTLTPTLTLFRNIELAGNPLLGSYSSSNQGK
ncbi:unnamed protein product, partial [Discosporangium mesarthrocarpum]